MTFTPYNRVVHLALGAALVAALASAPALAEVGVILDENPSQTVVTRPYIVRIIVDDPNPSGNMWQPLETTPPASRRPLNPQGAVDGDGVPFLVLHPETRQSIAVWGDKQAAGFDVVLSAFDGSAWTQPTVLGTSAGLDPVADPNPTLAIDPADGSVWVLWWEDLSWPRIMARRADADLGIWEPAVQVSAPSEFALNPSAVFHDGVLQVAYEVHNAAVNGTPKHIVRARAEAGGFTREVIEVSNGSMPSRPELHSIRDRLWVDWIDSADAIAWTHETSTGWAPVASEPFVSAEDRELFARGRIRSLVIGLGAGGP